MPVETTITTRGVIGDPTARTLSATRSTLTGTVALVRERNAARVLTKRAGGTVSMAVAGPPVVSTTAALTAQMTGSAEMTAAIGAAARLTAAMAGAATMATGIGARARITAAFGGSSSVTAVVRTQARLSAQMAGSSSMTAVLLATTADAPLSAQMTGSSSMTASLGARARLSTVMAGGSDVEAFLRASARLSAQMTGSASMVASIGVPLLLDTYTGSIGAWSLRRLAASTGDVVLVRRSNDNAEEGFTPEEIANGDMAAWVGAGNDGFVVTLYDQSVGGKHVSQITGSAQPQIVDAGSVILEGGEPAMDFAGTRYLTLGVGNSLDYSGGHINVFSVNQNPNAGVTDRLVADDIVGTQGYFLIRPKFSLAITINDGTGYKSDGSPVVYTTQSLLSMLFDGSTGSGEYFLDGTAQGVFTLSPWDGSIGTSGTAGFALGSGGNGGQIWSGTQQEVIIFGTDQTTNQDAIEQDIADHYGVTLA